MICLDTPAQDTHIYKRIKGRVNLSIEVKLSKEAPTSNECSRQSMMLAHNFMWQSISRMKCAPYPACSTQAGHMELEDLLGNHPVVMKRVPDRNLGVFNPFGHA